MVAFGGRTVLRGRCTMNLKTAIRYVMPRGMQNDLRTRCQNMYFAKQLMPKQWNPKIYKSITKMVHGCAKSEQVMQNGIG